MGHLPGQALGMWVFILLQEAREEVHKLKVMNRELEDKLRKALDFNGQVDRVYDHCTTTGPSVVANRSISSADSFPSSAESTAL
ncbi:uncharacterized protein LOC129600858 isoform X2 [Paramacrobiotus metropolitanus]|uniref:uncharacterized protein LOC129600858 isoform X2 n=1 Tax=Paramacrobiotus metropolitanus TaxID=2943436 RepID=UPI0024457DDE|nr:uncharacterized protein LOC129600858 isoform X2 [Paramacrobiotus metropolitanus]